MVCKSGLKEMDERANLLFYWFFKGRNSFKSRLPHPKRKPLGKCLRAFLFAPQRVLWTRAGSDLAALGSAARSAQY